MKKEVRLYNVLFPVWLLWLFPDLFDRRPRQPAGGLPSAHPGSDGPEAQKTSGQW